MKLPCLEDPGLNSYTPPLPWIPRLFRAGLMRESLKDDLVQETSTFCLYSSTDGELTLSSHGPFHLWRVLSIRMSFIVSGRNLSSCDMLPLASVPHCKATRITICGSRVCIPVLSMSRVWPHLVHITSLWHRHYYYHPRMEEATGAQRGAATCPTSHSW